MKKILIALLLMVTMAAGKVYCYYDQYNIGFSSGIPVSSMTYTDVMVIKAGDNIALNIDDMKFCCDGDATMQIALSTVSTGGYNATIIAVKPIGLGVNNAFTAKAAITAVPASALYFNSAMRLSANHVLNFTEYVGRITIPKGFCLIIRCQADAAGKSFYPMLRVWE